MVSLIRRLVETESPSGDMEGSRAVTNLLETAARAIPSVGSIVRIASLNRGEHLLIRAFDNHGDGNKPTLILGHTDTVHPRGALAAHRALRTEKDRLYGPGIFDMKASCVIAIEALSYLTSPALSPLCMVRLLLLCEEDIGSPPD